MISIDWGNRIIYVPKSDLTLVQLNPTEIYNMDLNWFRLQLKDLEDGEDGMAFPDTHRHNTEVSLSGLTYARVIEIINNYTVTFENGQYAVNLVGANSNVADRVNVNSVSVRSANSAGLTSAPAIEYSSFNGAVTIDVNSPYYGTVFPTGTFQQPVNNLIDALLISEYRGFNTIHLLSNLTVTSGINVDNYIFRSDDWWLEIHVEDFVSCFNTTFRKLSVFGTMGGVWNVLEDCWTYTISNFAGWLIGGSFVEVALAPYSDVSLGQSWFDNIVPMYPNENSIIIMNTDTSIACTSLNGDYELRAIEEGSLAVMGFNSGNLIIDNSCVGGDVIVNGIGILTDYSNGTVVNSTGFISKDTIVDSINESVGPQIEYASFDGAVHIDVNSTYSGVAFPYGTPAYPVNNLIDGKAIANERGFNFIHAESDLTISSGESIDYFIIKSDSWKVVTVENGASTNNTVFEKVSLYGVLSGYWNVIIDCWIYNVTNFCGWVRGGSFEYMELGVGDPGAEFGSMSYFDSILPMYPSVPGVLVMNSNVTVSFTDAFGVYEIRSMVAGTTLNFGLAEGTLILDSSCTGGDVTVFGVGLLYNNAASLTSLNSIGLVSNASVADAVGNSAGGLTVEEHNTLLSLPDTISGSGGGLTTEDRDRLWNIPIETLTPEEHDKLFSISNTISGSGLTQEEHDKLMNIQDTVISGSGLTDEDRNRLWSLPLDSGLTSEEHDKLLGLPDGLDIGTIVTDAINEEIGPTLLRMLGLLQENQYLDNTTYTVFNGQKLLSSGRIRTYSDAISVGTNNNVIATYQITTDWSGDEMTSYKVVKI